MAFCLVLIANLLARSRLISPVSYYAGLNPEALVFSPLVCGTSEFSTSEKNRKIFLAATWPTVLNVDGMPVNGSRGGLEMPLLIQTWTWTVLNRLWPVVLMFIITAGYAWGQPPLELFVASPSPAPADYAWILGGSQGVQIQSSPYVANPNPSGWSVAAVADLNRDSNPDIIWVSSSGQIAVWYMLDPAGTRFGSFQWIDSSGQMLTGSPGYRIVGFADLDGNGYADMVLESTDGLGSLLVKYLGGNLGNTVVKSLFVNAGAEGWNAVGVADMNGDGHPDIVWQHPSTRQVAVWYLTGADGNQYLGFGWISSGSQFGWTAKGAIDLDGNGVPDIIWQQDSSGQVAAWHESYSFPDPQFKDFAWFQSQPQSMTGWNVIVPLQSSAPTSSTLIPFGWVSSAETLMFTTTATSPFYFTMVIENAGTYSANGNVDPKHACYILYFAPGAPSPNPSNVILLGDDYLDSQYWANPGGSTPGTQGQVSNSQCTLDVSRSWVQVNGTQMILQLALTFQPSWSGAKEVYVDVGGTNGGYLYWTNRGSWTVPSYSQVPVTTDHYDVLRTGANVHETTLNILNAGSVNLKGTISLPATDGCIWGQPLYVPGVTVGGGVHNVLYFATGHANVYAYDADSFSFLWSRALGSSLGGATPPNPSMVGGGFDPDLVDCGNRFGSTGSESGVVGTPAIDLSSNTMYVVGNLNVGNSVNNYMFGIDISTGSDRMTPNLITSTGQMSPQFVASQHLQRPGLLLADYNVVASYASYANHAFPLPYQGWMFDFNRYNLLLLDDWNYAGSEPDPYDNLCGNSRGGATIWMSAGGPAFDGANVYFATGNNNPDNLGPPPTPVGCSNSVLQVSPYGGRGGVGTAGGGFAQINKFTPAQSPLWIGGDVDLASSRVIVVPGTNNVLVGGKSGNIYVVDRTSLSQQAAFNIRPSFDLNQTAPEISGGLAYWRQNVYTWGGGDGFLMPDGENLRAHSLTGTPGPVGSDLNHTEQGIPISISATFDDPNTGLVWAVVPPYPLDPHSDNPQSFVTGTLQVYNASSLAAIPCPGCNLGGNYIMKFTPPLVVNGKVYVVTVKNLNGTASGSQVMIFGL